MSAPGSAEQAVLVYLKLSDDEFGEFDEREAIFALEDRLIEAITSKSAGEYDGHEFGEGFGTLYMYGESADALYQVALPIVREYSTHSGPYD